MNRHDIDLTDPYLCTWLTEAERRDVEEPIAGTVQEALALRETLQVLTRECHRGEHRLCMSHESKETHECQCECHRSRKAPARSEAAPGESDARGYRVLKVDGETC